MFVKNVIEVLLTSSINICHDNTSIYLGVPASVPFYLNNEKVIGVDIETVGGFTRIRINI